MDDLLYAITLEAVFQLSPFRDSEYVRGKFLDMTPEQVCMDCYEIQWDYDHRGFYCPECGSGNIIDVP